MAGGRADIAAIDAVTWRMIERLDADLAARLRVVAGTPPTPGLPYICAAGRDATRTADAVDAALSALPPDAGDILGLRRLVRIPAAAYLSLPVPPPPPT